MKARERRRLRRMGGSTGGGIVATFEPIHLATVLHPELGVWGIVSFCGQRFGRFAELVIDATCPACLQAVRAAALAKLEETERAVEEWKAAHPPELE